MTTRTQSLGQQAVILTALPVECTAVLAYLKDVEEITHPAGSIYWQGRFAGTGTEWRVAVAAIGAHNEVAAVEAERAIQHFNPSVAMFVGVAGGLKDVSVGDVVAAPWVYGYESGKDEAEFMPRPNVSESSHALVHRARAEAIQGRWIQRITGPAPTKPPRALPGPIAAGAKVVANTRSATYLFLRKQYSDALAVEMEGRGFLAATHANQHVYSIVVRGISDCIDAKAEADSTGSQEIASRHAGAFAFELLARFTLPPLNRGEGILQDRLESQGPVWTAIPPRNPNFTGREALLSAIRSHFLSPSALPRPQALFGLGGVGKTQLSVEYASRHALDEQNYSHVLWIRSEEPSVLASDYAKLADAIGLPEREEPDQQSKIDAVRRWLQQHEDWLLVFDNAEQPAAVQPFLPISYRGHILITSRNPAWGEIATPRHIDVLVRADAIAFLQRRTRQDDSSATDALAYALGDLPLALSQSSAYIEQTGCSIKQYLMLFEQRKQDLLILPSAPVDYPYTIAATWSLSFERIQEQSPAAADLLSLCSFLAPSLIPIEMLAKGADSLPTSLSSIVTDELQLDKAVRILRQYSLAQVSNQALLFHRLVQAVMTHRLRETGIIWATAALNLIHGFFRFDTFDLRTWERCAFLLPHAAMVVAHAQRLKIIEEPLLQLLTHVGSYWEDQGEYQAARSVLALALELSQSLPVESSWARAGILQLLGAVDLRLGSALDAKQRLEEALTVIRAHPEQGDAADGLEAAILNDLAMVYFELEMLHEAESLARQSLSLKGKMIPEDSPWLGLTLGNLGLILMRRARFEEGRHYIERALSSTEKQHGPKHPRVATHLNNLANILREQGHYEEAQKNFERALQIVQEIYGSTHPSLAPILRNLGDIYLRREDLTKARDCCSRALQIDEACLGPDHVSVAIDLNELARVLHALGELEAARKLYERAVSIKEMVYGKEYGGLATTLDNLGRVQENLDDLLGARASFERSLKLHEQAHGRGHPLVANVLNNLGHLLGQRLGELSLAREYLERALSIDESVHGPAHPEVATDSCNLAVILLNQEQDHDRAFELLKRAAAICDSPSPPPAIIVALTFFHLGLLLTRLGQWKDARVSLERALHIQEQLALHNRLPIPQTLMLLSSVLHTLGETNQAITYMDRALMTPQWLSFGTLSLTFLDHLRKAFRQLGRIHDLRTRLEQIIQVAEASVIKDVLFLASFELGRIYHEDNRLEDALQQLNHALSLSDQITIQSETNILQILKRSGEIYLALERWQEAKATFEAMLSRQDDNSQPLPPSKLAAIHCNLGIALLNLESPKRALIHMNHALSLATKAYGPTHPEYANILYNIAEIQETLGKYRDALRHFKRALKIFEGHDETDPDLLSLLHTKIRILSP